jgi:hypothetical protein
MRSRWEAPHEIVQDQRAASGQRKGEQVEMGQSLRPPDGLRLVGHSLSHTNIKPLIQGCQGSKLFEREFECEKRTLYFYRS